MFAAKPRRIGYVRVSDRDQTEALQIDALTKAGCDIIYGDHGVSGARLHRKGLDEVLQTLEPGDTLLVWKLDRLGRSTLHLLQLLAELRAQEIDFCAITQGIDTTTPMGRLLYAQLAIFAEFERDQISDRTRAGMAAARKRGVRLGRPKALSDRQVRRIRQRLEAGQASLSQAARELGVSRQTLARAINAQN